MKRRAFLRTGAGLAAASLARRSSASPARARVALVRTADRAAGVSRAIDLFGAPSFSGKDLFVKPNFNSADPPPGSTHLDTLSALLRKLRALKAGALTVGDRSGMGVTREVFEKRGVFALAREQGAAVVVLDELPAEKWKKFEPPGSHWQRGFYLPVPALQASAIVQTCCLKTHRYGGHFTLSLKNSVGLVAKRVPGDPYNYMSELHSSPHQRDLIAEINAAYTPALVVLDGVEAFVTGGPDTGDRVAPNVMLAGTDRVAIDAVGVAILRLFGTTPEVSRGPIFAQDQLARAAALGVGVGSGEAIDLVTADAESAAFAARIRPLLAAAS